MRFPDAHRTDSQRGQASVELLGSLPAALIAIAVSWQLVLAGHTAWVTANAARVAARAAAVGSDPRAAAHSALPSYLDRGMQLVRRGERVSIRVRLPVLIGRWSSPARIGASASMESQR